MGEAHSRLITLSERSQTRPICPNALRTHAAMLQPHKLEVFSCSSITQRRDGYFDTNYVAACCQVLEKHSFCWSGIVQEEPPTLRHAPICSESSTIINNAMFPRAVCFLKSFTSTQNMYLQANKLLFEKAPIQKSINWF